jgi:MazG family protein
VSEKRPFDELVELCARLRGPGGCPWDREQTFESLRAYLIEETYEVVDAITAPEPAMLAGELGDLLFHIVFVAQMASEKGWFDADTVCRGVHAKMVRRHPHVFGDVEVASTGDVIRNWEAIKQKERTKDGALAGVPRHLPALLKAMRITEKAAAVGFDWERVEDVVTKLEEEVSELAVELRSPPGEERQARARDELGDVLFVMANLARQLGFDPEAALQSANDKFARRFSTMEQLARARGLTLAAMGLTQLDALWVEVKAGEREDRA